MDQATRKGLLHQLGLVTDYVHKLTDEYRDQYLRIAAIQRAITAWESAQAETVGTLAEPPAAEDIVVTTTAWQQLTDRTAFPRLAILLDGLEAGEPAEAHQAELSRPIDAAIETLLAGTPRSAAQAIGP